MTNALLASTNAEPSKKVGSRYVGAILGLVDDVLHGWAVDTDTLSGAPVIEVFIDGTSVALARADQYEPIADAPHGFCGFTVQLRREWLNSANAISATIANTTVTLPGTIKSPIDTRAESAAIASQLWHTGGLRVVGWSWDPQDPTRHVTLRVKEGDEVVCEVVCNEPHQALAYRDTCDHGFTIDLPWALADGDVHILTVEDDEGRLVAGSPIRICCVPGGMEALIRGLSNKHDPSKIAMLEVLAQDANLRFPKSVGWHCYPEWYEVFQRLDESPPRRLSCPVGILLLKNDTTTAQDRAVSIASVGKAPAGMMHVVEATQTDVRTALNQLLEMGCATVLPIQSGDRLAPGAIFHLGTLVDDGSAWGYADCDQDGPNGERTNPWLKPVWDIDYFIGTDVFTPGAIFSAALIQRVMNDCEAEPGENDLNWDSVLAGIALATEVDALSVVHLPYVLYHRSSSRHATPEKCMFSTARFDAMSWLCNRLIPESEIESLNNAEGLFRAKWPLPMQLPKVSLIVPTRDQYRLLTVCIEGLLSKTDYPNLEIIIMDNQSSDPEVLSYFEQLASRNVRVIAHPFPFNYSAINNEAVKHATGEIIGLINNDIEILHASWLKDMVAHLLRPNVGIVGAKLLWPNRMVQHGGVVVGVNGLAAHVGNQLAQNDSGYMATNLLTRQQSAVTAACLIMKKSDFESVGGLDEISYPIAFNDVDLCMRMREFNKRVLWSAEAILLHAESASRGKDIIAERRARADREQSNFIKSWGAYEDRHYHASLSKDYLSGPYGGLSLEPTISARK